MYVVISSIGSEHTLDNDFVESRDRQIGTYVPQNAKLIYKLILNSTLE